jgi:hypothetical protein
VALEKDVKLAQSVSPLAFKFAILATPPFPPSEERKGRARGGLIKALSHLNGTRLVNPHKANEREGEKGFIKRDDSEAVSL